MGRTKELFQKIHQENNHSFFIKKQILLREEEQKYKLTNIRNCDNSPYI